MSTEYRIVPRKISTLFGGTETVLILQHYVEVKGFQNGWVIRNMQWVNCDGEDIQDVILSLFCKGEK